ncbi:MAG: hypothetical protein HY815_34255 [Candidatus Riflebacteria bacterium]|nr:hypothetical protein [Candidatus Riflebacteria bacterium]
MRLEDSTLEGCSPMMLFWHVPVGAVVAEGQGLCEVETAKSVVLVCAPASGTLAEICVESGEPIAPGQVLGRITLSRAGPADGTVVRVETAGDPDVDRR